MVNNGVVGFCLVLVRSDGWLVVEMGVNSFEYKRMCVNGKYMNL